MDSAVVASAIFAGWQRKGIRGFNWKVDFTKAYDSLEWDFLWSSMKRRGFSKKWIK